ncbi:MAG TPA: excinuclease ABC subunit A, partial [Balneolaceae bacterium]|nr:excinuclease ABC subunit A [Balneolaceae bacterium]
LKDDESTRTRIADSLETAFQEGQGRCSIKMKDGEELSFSERFEMDGIEFTEPTPQMFSFNNPFGACDNCEGIGKVSGIDEDLVIPEYQKTIRNGTIAPFDSQKFSMHLRDLIKVCAREKYSIDTAYADLPKEVKDVIWKGKDEYIGI